MKPVNRIDSRWRPNLGFTFILLILLFSYVLKGLFLVGSIHLGIDMVELSPDWEPIRLKISYVALFFSTISLISCFIFSKVFFREKYVDFAQSFGAVRLPFMLVGLSTVLAILVLYMRFITGAVMGMEPPDIPWYRGTLVYRAQQYLVPAIFLLVLHLSLHWGSRFLKIYSILGFFIFMALGAVITGSKAGIFFYFLFLGVFYWIFNDGIKLRLSLILIASILLVFSFIIGNEVREQILTGKSSNEWNELISGDLVMPVLNTLMHIFTRLTGIEGVAIYCSEANCGLLDFTNLGIFLDGSVGDFYTRDIVGVVNPFDFRSPGLVGGAVIGLGYVGAVFFVLLFSLFWAACARYVGRVSVTPVPLVSLHVGLILFTIEGTLVWLNLLVLAIAVLSVFIVERIFFVKTKC